MDWFLLFFIVFVVLPAWGQSTIAAARAALIHKIERKRGSRVIVLIHRQEVINLLGLPIVRFINIEDSERILRAIHLTPKDMPIDLIVHTPGGLVLAAQQIARALTRHHAQVTVMVPHYAMSGGTMIALAADEILMDENAVLGPTDPQIGSNPAVALLSLSKAKTAEKISDETMILIDIAEKSLKQVELLIRTILDDHMPAKKVKDEDIPRIVESLVSGVWTHDHPITVDDAKALGLPVQTGLLPEVYQLMDLYPQAGARQPVVSYLPSPRAPQPVQPAPHK